MTVVVNVCMLYRQVTLCTYSSLVAKLTLLLQLVEGGPRVADYGLNRLHMIANLE